MRVQGFYGIWRLITSLQFCFSDTPPLRMHHASFAWTQPGNQCLGSTVGGCITPWRAPFRWMPPACRCSCGSRGHSVISQSPSTPLEKCRRVQTGSQAGPGPESVVSELNLGIMYCGYMFVATSLHQYVLYCPLLHRPLRQYGAVRLDADITGELRESKSVSSSRFA